ncbi:MAG TPA: hypothetical protein PKM43_17320 [Verrucomicrobiota bacterium]|nr:hypothetical protein [Verrucomicrobiota bacterium]HRZ35400.1 hypothetical protein [Candidatus Paceibacterota bacterium]HRZ56668.1 hypothetical protein [Candidatus Paceibacterota bacterium]
MKAKLHVLGLLLGVASLPWLAQAGPFQRGQVSAEAIWCVHMDMQQMKQTQVGQYVMELLSTPEAQDRFTAFQAVFNFDPRLSLHGCTLYSRGLAPSDAVLLVQGDFDADRLVTLARAREGYQSSFHRTYILHSSVDRSRHGRAEATHRSYGAIHPHGMLVLGRSESRVAEALDVLDRLQPSLEQAPEFAQWTTSSTTACVVAAARRTEAMDFEPRAAFLRHCTLYSLVGGETAGELHLDTVLTASDEETARNILAIHQGFKGLLALGADRPAMARLAEATTLAQEGNQVQISIRMAASDVVRALHDAVARKAARRNAPVQ